MPAKGALLFLLCAGLFVIFWSFVLRLIARLGWSQLAERHSATRAPSPDGTLYMWTSLALGPLKNVARYNGCINVWVERDGMFLQPSLLFRPGHAMLFFRWADIAAIDEDKSGYAVRLMGSAHPDGPDFRIPPRPGKAAAQMWRAHNPSARRQEER